METNSRKDIRTILRRLIGQEIVTSLAHFASIKEVKLWGEDRPSDFELIAVELALFKDLTAVGYCRLAQNVRRWLKTTPKSLLHNQRVLCRIFKQWITMKLKILLRFVVFNFFFIALMLCFRR